MKIDITGRFIAVWQRNLTVYRESWKINFMPPLLEPLFYLAAFGIGFSGLIGSVRYGDMEVSYVSFIAPALIAVNIMNNSFFENTFASFVRMYYQKTFDAMMATPLTVAEIITGEIVWGATKAAIATTIMMIVIGFFGLLNYTAAPLIILIAFLGGMAFGSTGMIFTASVKTIELFNLPVFLFITPMFLFSGTFFPLANLPWWAQYLALALPLTHLTNVLRGLNFGQYNADVFAGICYLLLFNAVVFPVALRKMKRRLIK
ncbi:MAG TPA: ABC transporter permease [Smithellaceae bacterium]|nr:ABC transporter permease [Smithellaceae bacterium]